MTLEVVPTGPHQCVLATNFMRLAIAFAPANYTLPIEITNTRVCAVYVGSPFLVLDMQYAMTWAITLFIPNIQELVGLTLYLQAFHEYPDVQVFDAILSSNGLAATIIN